MKKDVMGSHNMKNNKNYNCSERMWGLPLGYRVWQVIVSKERY